MSEPGRSYEIELDFPRLLMLCGVLVAIVGTAFWVGRVTAPAAADAGSAVQAETHDAAEVPEQILERGSVFDRAGGSGSQREIGRQVVEEPSRGGGFELELGRTDGRGEAERLKAEAEAAGVPVMIVGAGEGGYRVVGGPYQNRKQAAEDAKRLERGLGRTIPVSASGR